MSHILDVVQDDVADEGLTLHLQGLHSLVHHLVTLNHL
jgi:hypothetical protein